MRPEKNKSHLSYMGVKRLFEHAISLSNKNKEFESAKIWKDGLEHLERIKEDRDRAISALEKAYDFMRRDDVVKVSLQEARKAAHKALEDHYEMMKEEMRRLYEQI